MTKVLRLRAEDEEDLHVLAAVLQDSLVPLTEMEFFSDTHRFALVASRFRWENCSETADSPFDPAAAEGEAPEPEVPDIAFARCASYERVNCGVCFEGVEQVRCRGVDRRERGRILELLTIRTEPGAVLLLFAGGAAIRLEGKHITCRMEDVGEPWPTRWRPHHPVADTA